MDKLIRRLILTTVAFLALICLDSGLADSEIVLPSGLTQVSEECFSDCEHITTVRIPAGVTQIMPSAFRGCKALKSVYIPETVTDIADNAFDDCPSCVLRIFKGSEIEDWAWRNQINYTYINDEQHQNGEYYYAINGSRTASIIKYVGEETEQLVLPDTIDGYIVTEIGEKAFEDCSATSIQLPPHLRKIGYEAFYYSSVAEFTITSELEKIESEAFMCCHSLTKFHIPASVTEMGSNPFRGCSSLETITVDPENPIFGTYQSALISKADMRLIVYPYALVEDTFLIPDGIKIIGGTAFGYEGPRFTTLIIPDSVETIGGSAFAFSNVQHIQIGSGVKDMDYGPFTYCGLLKDVTIAEGTTRIGSTAFRKCDSLETITIPDSVTYIADDAFELDYNISIIANPGSYAAYYAEEKGISNRKKYGDFLYEIHDESITIIRYKGTETGALTVPANIEGMSVTVIGDKAFEFCPASSIILPDTLLEIGYEAFYYSDATSINIPASVTTIAGEAFMCCSSVTEFSIPPSVTFMGENPFRGCRGLQAIHVEDDSSKYGIFSNALIEKDTMRLIVYPYGLVSETFAIPDGIKIIGDIAFGYEGPHFKTLIIPDSVEAIGNSAFAFSDVQHVQIGSGVMSMGYGPFVYCGSLQTVTIAEGTTVIGESAFRKCGNLASVSIPDSVKKIADNAFESDYAVNIIGTEGSYAIQYAKDKGFAYTLRSLSELSISGDA